MNPRHFYAAPRLFNDSISGKMHAVPASLKGKYVIRFTVTSPRTTANDIARDWQLIRAAAVDIVGPETAASAQRTRVTLKGKYSDDQRSVRP